MMKLLQSEVLCECLSYYFVLQLVISLLRFEVCNETRNDQTYNLVLINNRPMENQELNDHINFTIGG